MDSHFGDGTDCRLISDYYEVMANPIDEDTGGVYQAEKRC